MNTSMQRSDAIHLRPETAGQHKLLADAATDAEQIYCYDSMFRLCRSCVDFILGKLLVYSGFDVLG